MLEKALGEHTQVVGTKLLIKETKDNLNRRYKLSNKLDILRSIMFDNIMELSKHRKGKSRIFNVSNKRIGVKGSKLNQQGSVENLRM